MNDPIDIEKIDLELLRTVSNDLAWTYRAVPYEHLGEHLIFLSDNKDFKNLGNELEVLLNKQVILRKIDSNLMNQTLEKHYRKSERIRINENTGNPDFIKDLVLESISLKSSDIHLENGEHHARIRMRIDGRLIERYRLDKDSYPSIINKVKIKSGLDISEKRLPQDGRFQIEDLENIIDIRVSTTPTILGEKIVMRLLSRQSKNYSLDQTGMHEKQLEKFRSVLNVQNGIILISGPTGSGKTSTLYAALNELNTGDNNILTIEDPVEYTLDGINQVQLKETIGLGFSKALKAFLRQDPDIIMLGEIRDKDTANMAIRAALTGHLVFSTIHTNSAWSTISRLRDMEIPAYLIAGTIRMSIAQRLVRLLCENCKEIEVPISKILPDYLIKSLNSTTIYKAKACSKCHHTGYLGRKAIFEIIVIDRRLQKEIRNENDDEIQILKSSKITTLRDEAFHLLKTGQTSIEEVFPLLLDNSN